MGGVRKLCEEPPGGVQRGRGGAGQQGVLGGGERKVPAGGGAHAAQLHHDAAHRDAARQKRDGKVFDDVQHPAPAERADLDSQRGGRDRAVRPVREQQNGTGEGGKEGSVGTVWKCGDKPGVPDERDRGAGRRREVFAAPVEGLTGRERRHDEGKHPGRAAVRLLQELYRQLDRRQRGDERGRDDREPQLYQLRHHQHDRNFCHQRPDRVYRAGEQAERRGHQRHDRGRAGETRGENQRSGGRYAGTVCHAEGHPLHEPEKAGECGGRVDRHV